MAAKMHVTLFLSSFIAISYGQSTINCTASECTLQSIQAAEIQCQGEHSCRGSSLTSNNKASGFIDCSGYLSCDSRDVNQTQYPSTITAANNVYCSGGGSCQGSGAINAKNIYCTGATSCALYIGPASSILGADRNVYCYGTDSCVRRLVEPGKKAVCGGVNACWESTIRGGISIFGYSHFSARNKFYMVHIIHIHLTDYCK